MALFPSSPTNGQTTTVNDTIYTYNSAQTAWIKTGAGAAGDFSVSGNITATGNVVANNLSGNLTTAAQPNITSVGTLSSLGVSGSVTASTLVSNVSIGTAPLTVTSTTKVTNLNADLLDGYNTATANTASTVAVRDANGNVSANFFIGNGSQLTGIITSVSNVTNGTSNLNISTSGGNITLAVAGSNVANFTSTGLTLIGTTIFTGNGNGLSQLAGGNVTGWVANANVANYSVTTATSTGTYYLHLANATSGNVALSANTNINVAVSTGALNATLLGGTLTTAAQPNITSVGTLGSLTATGTVSGGNLSTGGNLSVSGNAVITGNLTVDGNIVYVNVETFTVEDPIIQLQTGPNGAAPSSNSGKDVGTALNYYDSQARLAFMGWDVSNAEFGMGSVVSLTNEVVTFTTYGNLRVGNIIGNGQALTGLNAANIASGNVAVSAGGTGSTTLTANNLITGNGTGNVTFIAAGTSGNVLTSNGTNWVSSAASGGNSSSSYTVTGAISGNSNVSTVTGTFGLRTVASTYTDNVAAASATIANAAVHAIATPTLAASNATVTATNAATFYIASAPTAGTNMTITNPYALYVAAGNSFLSGNVTIGSGSTGNITGANVISATTLQGFISPTAGTTGTAPITLSNTGVLTSATTVGAIEYDGTALYGTENSTTGRGEIGIYQAYRYTTAGSALGPTIADYFPATSSINLEASSFYDIECVAYFLKTTGATVTFTWTNSSAPNLLRSYYVGTAIAGFTTTTVTTAAVTGLAVAQAVAAVAHAATGTLTTAVYHYFHFKVFVATNAATNLRFRITSASGTVTPQAGSYYTVRKLSANAGNFVA